MTTDTLKSTRCPSVSDLDRQIAALLQQDDETCLRIRLGLGSFDCFGFFGNDA